MPDIDTVFVVSGAPSALVEMVIYSFVLTIVAALGVLTTRRAIFRDVRDWFLKFVSIVSLTILLITLGGSAWRLFVVQAALVSDYKDGRYQMVTGCLSRFSRSTSQGHTPDRLAIGGKTLSYSDNMENGGYHKTEISGGEIHADTWVRLYSIGDVIVRADIRQHACPQAPTF